MKLLMMLEIAIKYHKYITSTHHSQESRERGGTFLPHSAISTLSRKIMNLFLVLLLR